MLNFLKKPIDAAKEKISDYLNVRIEEAKLTTVEKASPIAASLLIWFIILFIAFLIMLFLGLSLAEWFAVLMNSVALGYLCTAGVYVVMLLILIIFFKQIATPLTNKIAQILYDAFH